MVCGHRRKVVPGSAKEAYLRKTGLVQCRARHDALCYMALQKVQEAKVVTTNKRSS